MSKQNNWKPIDLDWVLPRMKAYAKKKDKQYQKQQKFAKKMFADVIKQIGLDRWY
jgi:hypothetical protein